MKTRFLIIFPAILLSFLSLVILASIAPNKVLPQAIFLVLALILSLLVYRLGWENVLMASKAVYLAAIILLLATFFFGKVTRGSTRWIRLGNVQFQTSELAKPAVILAGISLVGNGWPIDRKRRLRLGLKYLLAAGLPLGLVLLQPDLGSALILFALSAWVFFASGPPKSVWLPIFVGIMLLLPAGKLFLKDYQIKRIEAFINPYAEPRGAGYHVIQSTITIGSGQIFGRGLGRGTQGKLKFLPEKQTDFIFASLAEELGLVGSALVISLYFLIVFDCFKTAGRFYNFAPRALLSSVGMWIFFQASVNIAMNLGLAPVTGITLPFLSYGGSSLAVSGMMLALAASIDESPKRLKFAPI